MATSISGPYLLFLPRLVPAKAGIDWTGGWIWAGALIVHCRGFWEGSYVVSSLWSLRPLICNCGHVNHVFQSVVAQTWEKLLKTQSEGRIGLCVPLSLACTQLITESGLLNRQLHVPKSPPVTSNHIWMKAQNLPQGPRRPGKIWSLPILSGLSSSP